MDTMKSGRAYVLALAMLTVLTVLAAGCSADGGIAGGPENSQVDVASARAKLDGVRFDVRRDPG